MVKMAEVAKLTEKPEMVDTTDAAQIINFICYKKKLELDL